MACWSSCWQGGAAERLVFLALCTGIAPESAYVRAAVAAFGLVNPRQVLALDVCGKPLLRQSSENVRMTEGHTAAADAWPPSVAVINEPALTASASRRNRPCCKQTLLLRHGLLIGLLTQHRTGVCTGRGQHQRHNTPNSQSTCEREVALRSTMPHNSLHSMQSLTAGSKASIMCSTGAACPASTATATGPSAGQECGTGHAHVMYLTLDYGPHPAGCSPTTNSNAALSLGRSLPCHPALEYTHDRNSSPDTSTNLSGTPPSQKVAAINPCRHAWGNNKRSQSMRAAAGYGGLPHAVPCARAASAWEHMPTQLVACRCNSLTNTCTTGRIERCRQLGFPIRRGAQGGRTCDSDSTQEQATPCVLGAGKEVQGARLASEANNHGSANGLSHCWGKTTASPAHAHAGRPAPTPHCCRRRT